MNISWVLSDLVLLDPTQDPDDLKRIGTFWGSWRTWRACQTDNVLCHDQAKAAELLKRNFQTTCNFYIPNSIYTSLDRPAGVKLYEGAFVHDVDRQEEIVALHLAASTNDIVLLLGFNLTKLEPNPDRLKFHQAQHHRNLFRQAIKNHDHVQWVIVDHLGQLDANLANLPNVSTDTLTAVLAQTTD
jgi:hypothetical protein